VSGATVAVGWEILRLRIKGYGPKGVLPPHEEDSINKVWTIRDALGFLLVALEQGGKDGRDFAEAAEGLPDGMLDAMLRDLNRVYGSPAQEKGGSKA
jgi:hypothetical protein